MEAAVRVTGSEVTPPVARYQVELDFFVPGLVATSVHTM